MIDPSAGTPEIRITDLSKHFRDVRAVDRVSLDIRTGEFFSMLGTIGFGKTTKQRIIFGFELQQRRTFGSVVVTEFERA